MTGRRTIHGIAAIFILGASALAGGQAGTGPGDASQPNVCWLINYSPEIKDRWLYREGTADGQPLEKYQCLRPTGELWCKETDIGRCTLPYFADLSTDKIDNLPIRPQKGRWVSLKPLRAMPDRATVFPKPDSKLDAFKEHTSRGGSKGGAACGGDLALRSPVCGEFIDLSDFTIRWPGNADDIGKSMSILVERVDGHSALFRDVAATARREYATDKLLEFLKSQQGRNDPVDMTVTVMSGNGRQAVRLVHIPSSVQTERYNSRIRDVESSDALWKTLQRISFALDESMWSKAAEETRRLLDLTPNLNQLHPYALAGLCQSDFEEEKIQLRMEMPKEQYESVCGGVSGGAVAANGTETRPIVEQAQTVPQPAVDRTRLGVALLIGNSDYWNLPLNSVKSDVQGMRDVLASLGFQAIVKENLKDPKEFQEALHEFLRKENPTPDDILLVYYSGHGIQIGGKAHLLGTGFSAAARAAEDVRSNAQSAEELLAEMERAVPGTRVLIVDACRNNFFTAPSAQGGQSPRAGFAFQQDDVPNTFVMFANRPGLPTPARSDYGLMGPFTESLIYSLRNSSGEIQEAFALAEKKTQEISPGQDPVMYTSKKTDQVILRQHERERQVDRAAELLNGAEVFYKQQAWDQFLAIVDRAQHLAVQPALRERLKREVDFAHLVMGAQSAEELHDWPQAGAKWQGSYEIFPARRWLAMKAAVAWLMADDLPSAVRPLASLSAEPEGQLPLDAKQILGELVKQFPELAEAAGKAAGNAPKPTGAEFELIGDKE
jgi:hypothetical protein